MKKVLWGLGVLIALGLVALVLLYVFLGRIIKKGIETSGPLVTKCPVTVDRVYVRPLRGKLHLVNFAIGNPAGYKTAYALKVKHIRVSVVPRSLRTDLIHVKEVYIGGPQITYEIGLGKTNIGTIQDNVDAFVKSMSGPTAPAAGGSKKKVTIDVVKVENGKIIVAGTLLPRETVPVLLPIIEMRDIGKGDPVTGAQAAAEILNRVLLGVLDSVRQSGIAALGAARDIIGEAVKGTDAELKKGLGGAVGGVKGLFRKGD